LPDISAAEANILQEIVGQIRQVGHVAPTAQALQRKMQDGSTETGSTDACQVQVYKVIGHLFCSFPTGQEQF
jgi:hypothetical protein